MTSCAITGHRPRSIGYAETSEQGRRLKYRMLGVLSGLYRKGVRRYYVGGALGVDMWAGELLAWMKGKDEYSDLELIMAVPFPGYDDRWMPKDRERLRRLAESCTEIVTVTHVNSTASYLQRNRYMADRADCLFAVYDRSGNFHSGTRYTVEYALKKELPVWILDPDTLELITI